MVQFYLSFKKGLFLFFILNWSEYLDFFMFKGGLNLIIGSLWLSDIVYYYLVLVVLFIFVGYMYCINWGIGYSMKEILEVYKGLFIGEGYKGFYEILIILWYVQLVINLVMMGLFSIIVVYYMYVMLLYLYIGVDYLMQLLLFIYYMWIGGFCICGVVVYGVIFMVCDYSLV